MSRIYKTEFGDTWDLIAFKQFGSEAYMKELMEANLPLTETLVFDGGTDVVIPDIPVVNTSNLPFWHSDVDNTIWATEA